jgi:hypothetical protein
MKTALNKWLQKDRCPQQQKLPQRNKKIPTINVKTPTGHKQLPTFDIRGQAVIAHKKVVTKDPLASRMCATCNNILQQSQSSRQRSSTPAVSDAFNGKSQNATLMEKGLWLAKSWSQAPHLLIPSPLQW